MDYFSDFKSDFLKNILGATEKNYKSRSRQLIIDFANNPDPYLPEIVSTFQQIFENFSEFKPMILLNSLRFLKEIMDLKTQGIASQIEKSIYPQLLNLARFRQNDKEDDDRGRFLFSSNQNQQKLTEYEAKEQLLIGNTCLRLCLECILMWRLYYPKSQFDIQAEKLLDEGVKFPSDINYFKKYDNYLKNPREKNKFENLDLYTSNDSPDNLFEGYQSEKDVLNKIEKGLDDFDLVKKDFQRNLAESDGKLLNDKKFIKIMEKLQEADKKSFKLQETVMHSNLEEKIRHKYMEVLFENLDFFEEVLDDYKQLNNKQIKEAFFLAKYRGNITNSEEIERRKSSISNISAQFKSVDKIQAMVLTKDEFINKFGKDANPIQKRLSNRIDKPQDPDIHENGLRGQFFTESEEIPKDNQEAYSGKLVLKKMDFGNKSLNSEDQGTSAHYVYLEKQFSALKKKETKASSTLNGHDLNLPKVSGQGDATINTVNITNDKFPLIPEKIIRRISESGLEERDQISNLSQHVPTFGGIFLQSSKLFSEDFSSVNEEMANEKRRLLERLELLQTKEKEMELMKKGLTSSDKRTVLIRRIEEKNQQINGMKQKLRNLVKLNEILDSEEGEAPYLDKLQNKYQQLQKENKLLKHLLKISSNPSSTGYTSINFNQRSSRRPISTIQSRNNSIRSIKINDRGSMKSDEIERKSNGLIHRNEDFFLKELQITNNYKENIQRLKLCCVKNKGVLYKNQELQIGVLTDLQNHKERKLWKIYLYFENISKNNVISNLILNFNPGENLSIWVKSKEECINTLKTHEQNIKEIIIDYKAIPFKFALLEFKYQCLDKINRNVIAIPNSIMKLINFINSDFKEIESYWTQNKEKAIKTENFEIGSNYFEEKTSFANFFPYFIEKKGNLQKIEGLEKKEFLCKFRIFGIEGIVKLTVLIQKNGEKFVGVLKMIFAENEGKNIELSDFLLCSFKFLLVKV